MSSPHVSTTSTQRVQILPSTSSFHKTSRIDSNTITRSTATVNRHQQQLQDQQLRQEELSDQSEDNLVRRPSFFRQNFKQALTGPVSAAVMIRSSLFSEQKKKSKSVNSTSSQKHGKGKKKKRTHKSNAPFIRIPALSTQAAPYYSI